MNNIYFRFFISNAIIFNLYHRCNIASHTLQLFCQVLLRKVVLKYYVIIAMAEEVKIVNL